MKDLTENEKRLINFTAEYGEISVSDAQRLTEKGWGSAKRLLKKLNEDAMKPLPAPPVPGNTDAERMSNALNIVLKVSKADLLRKEARLKRANDKKRAIKT